MKKIILLALLIGQVFAFSNIEATKENILKLQKQHIKIIDIRLPIEWEGTGTIPNALKITFFKNSGAKNPQFLKELRKNKIYTDTKFALICRTGHRSSRAAEILEQNGYKNIVNLKDGMFNLFKSLLKGLKNGK